MRRIHKVIGGLLVAGVLIMGIGSGMAFAEYSSFEYGGDVFMNGSKRFTKTVEYSVPVQEDKKELGIIPFYHSHYTIVENTDISKDKVEFVIHYISDDETITPTLFELETNPDDTKCAVVELDLDYEYNELREIMRLKEPILEDFKNSQISNYQLDGVEIVEIHVNPDADFTIDVDYLEDEYYYDYY